MPGNHRCLPVALGLFALAYPAAAESWILSTPTYSLTWAEFWKLSGPAVGDTVNTVDYSGRTVEILGHPVAGSPDLEAAAAARAAAVLSMQGRPEKTWDSLEVQGAHEFLVAEWRDTSALAADTLIRARTFALRREGILFLATLRYRPGGCTSTLFSVRAALATLSLKDASPIRRGRTAGDGPIPASRPAGGWDALGRMTAASPWIPIFLPPGKSPSGYDLVSKAARVKELPSSLPYHGCLDPSP